MDVSVREKWDYLQRKIRCCGVQNYKDYRNLENGTNYMFPESCCINYEGKGFEGCSSRFPKAGVQLTPDLVGRAFYYRGCIDILEEVYTVRQSNYYSDCCNYSIA